jgi:hypothetical protein
MTCREVERLLPEFLEDALDGDQRAMADRHVRSCARCRELVRQFEDSLALFLAHQPPVEAPALEKLCRRIRSEALQRTGSRGRLWATALIPSLAGAAALIAVAIVLWSSRPQPGVSEMATARGARGDMPRVGYVRPETQPVPTADLSAAATETEAGETVSAPPAARATADSPPHLVRRHPARGALSPPPAEPAGELLVVAPEPAMPTETHSYAYVVSEWTVRECDQVLTMADADATGDDEEAEPVRTALYAIVPKSYAVRATTYVRDPVVEEEAEAAAGPPDSSTSSGAA